mmetsp:Transcript_24227/g.33867  ORF Transcript_24227/g.33867 Transcript_24227/m.33867 type:complete len:88 (-) Transcript_24227:718-981(-)
MSNFFYSFVILTEFYCVGTCSILRAAAREKATFVIVCIAVCSRACVLEYLRVFGWRTGRWQRVLCSATIPGISKRIARTMAGDGLAT